MKILAICGSPRKGNTEFMLKTVLDSVKNHEKELVLLMDLDLKHCIGCSVCQKTEKCVLKDDMSDLLQKMIDADVIIFGSPAYFDDVTGLMKDFIDRCHPFYKEKRLKGKKIVLLSVGHAKVGEGSIERVIETMKIFCEVQEMEVINEFMASSGESKIPEDEKLIKKLKELGEKI